MAALTLCVPTFGRTPNPATISAEAKTTAAEEDLALDKRPTKGWGDLTHVTCTVCLDVMYRPVIALPCLHTFCGHFLGNVCRIARKHICPECRTHVNDSRHDHKTQSLIDSFLKANPTFESSPEVRKQFDAMYPLGGSIFGSSQQRSTASPPTGVPVAMVPLQAQIAVLVCDRNNPASVARPTIINIPSQLSEATVVRLRGVAV